MYSFKLSGRKVDSERTSEDVSFEERTEDRKLLFSPAMNAFACPAPVAFALSGSSRPWLSMIVIALIIAKRELSELDEKSL